MSMIPAKLMANSSLAGLYGGIVVALLVGLLNPDGGAGARAPALLAVGAAYTLAAAVLWPALYGALRFFASGRLRVGWFSPRYVLVFHVANMTVILTSAWTTLSLSRGAVFPAARERLVVTCWSLSLAWLLAALLALAPRLSRARAVTGSVLALSIVALAVPAATGSVSPAAAASARRSRSGVPPAHHLLLLNFDGADLDTILGLEARGQLPSFSRLRETGTYGRLRSVRPCEAAVTRATLLTGREPYGHGVRSARSRRLLGRGLSVDVAPVGIGFDRILGPFMEARPRTIDDRRALTIADIVSRVGGIGRAAGWEIDLDEEGNDGPSTGVDASDEGALRGLLDPEAARAADPDARERFGTILRSLAADDRVLERFDAMVADCPAGVTALSFPGLDAVAHVFLRHARPERFGNVPDAEVEAYGEVLGRYYRHMDRIVGRAAAACGEKGFLFVTSTHGIDAAPLGRRMIGQLSGGGTPSGIHERGPYGFLFARGPHLKEGETFGRGSLVDIVPTALYALEMPVARDLNGRILTGIFQPRYISLHPVTVIGTYEPPA